VRTRGITPGQMPPGPGDELRTLVQPSSAPRLAQLRRRAPETSRGKRGARAVCMATRDTQRRSAPPRPSLLIRVPRDRRGAPEPLGANPRSAAPRRARAPPSDGARLESPAARAPDRVSHTLAVARPGADETSCPDGRALVPQAREAAPNRAPRRWEPAPLAPREGWPSPPTSRPSAEGSKPPLLRRHLRSSMRAGATAQASEIPRALRGLPLETRGRRQARARGP